MLQSRGALDDAQVLDLFAGSGALGLEALSRGARTLTAVDSQAAASRASVRNAQGRSVDGQLVTHRFDLLAQPDTVARRLTALSTQPFSLVFADPPYAEAHHCGPLLDALVKAELLTPDALVVVEYAKAKPPPPPQTLTALKSYRYGDTAVTLYALDADPDS